MTVMEGEYLAAQDDASEDDLVLLCALGLSADLPGAATFLEQAPRRRARCSTPAAPARYSEESSSDLELSQLAIAEELVMTLPLHELDHVSELLQYSWRMLEDEFGPSVAQALAVALREVRAPALEQGHTLRVLGSDQRIPRQRTV